LVKISEVRSREEKIKEICLRIFTKSKSLSELENNFKKCGFEYYNSRGKS
jgi:hypothetical protein